MSRVLATGAATMIAAYVSVSSGQDMMIAMQSMGRMPTADARAEVSSYRARRSKEQCRNKACAPRLAAVQAEVSRFRAKMSKSSAGTR